MATERQHRTYALPDIRDVSADEAGEIFDRQARKYLGMTGEEFLRKWDAGEIHDPDQAHIVRQVLMIPLLGRPIVLPADE
jgi:hypothetical protein